MSDSQANEADSTEDPESDGLSNVESTDGKDKSPIVAALLSWVFPGLGHFYGQGIEARGLLFAVVALISYALVFVGVGLFTSPVVVLIACIDAYMQTDNQN